MELKSVLTKKQFERDRIEQIENRITSRVTISFLDSSDVMDANRLQSETLLYPMDALLFLALPATMAFPFVLLAGAVLGERALFAK